MGRGGGNFLEYWLGVYCCSDPISDFTIRLIRRPCLSTYSITSVSSSLPFSCLSCVFSNISLGRFFGDSSYIVHHIKQDFLSFSYELMFDRIMRVLVIIKVRGHLVMSIIQFMNLISMPSRCHSRIGLYSHSRRCPSTVN